MSESVSDILPSALITPETYGLRHGVISSQSVSQLVSASASLSVCLSVSLYFSTFPILGA